MSNIHHRQLGETGLQIPNIVFGATSLGNLFVAKSDQEKRELIQQWFRQVPAPVAIDTAGKYGAGLSLDVIGRELAALDVDPADVVISNKLAWRAVPLTTPEPTFEPGVWIDIDHDAVQDISYDGILRCWEDGQARLGHYRQDLISVHDPDEYLDAATDPDDRQRRLEDIVDAYRALTELRDSGQAAGVGVGAKNWRVIEELDRHCKLDWVMMANTLTIMRHPPELLDFCRSLADRGIAIINSALTHGGFLTGGDFFDYHPIDPNHPADVAAVQWRQRYTDFCNERSLSPYETAVAFGRSHPSVTTIALSTSRPERTAGLVAAASATLAPETLRDLIHSGLVSKHWEA